jgi:cell volume regulation protein A
MQPAALPDPHLLGDFVVSGEVILGDLAEIYGVIVEEHETNLTLADYFDIHLDRAPRVGATLPLDSLFLVARNISGGRVNVVGLRLPEDEVAVPTPTRIVSLKQKLAQAWSSLMGLGRLQP